MIAMRFVDTNVLLYAVSRHPDETGKAQTARELLRQPDLGLSVQVLQEFYVQATRATAPHPLTHEQAAALVESFRRYWDAAILEAARALGCHRVLSEDLSHGQEYGGVRVENPFLG